MTIPTSRQAIRLECVQQAGARASALTSQLLAFGRRSIVKTVAIDLNEILLRLEDFLRRLIGEDIERAPRPGFQSRDGGFHSY